MNTNTTMKILPHMCEQQRVAMQELLEAADEIGAAATSTCTHGGQGYTSLRQARSSFEELLTNFMEKSRICIEED